MKSNYCQVDETTTPVIDKERHKAAREYLWMVRAVMERLGFEQALDENKAVAEHALTEIQRQSTPYTYHSKFQKNHVFVPFPLHSQTSRSEVTN